MNVSCIRFYYSKQVCEKDPWAEFGNYPRSPEYGRVLHYFPLGVLAFPGGTSGKESAFQCRRHRVAGSSLGQEDTLEEGMATHSSILGWRIQWTQEPCGQQFIGLQRVEHNWSNLTYINNGRKSPYPLKPLLNYLRVKCMISGFYLKILQDKKQR